MPLMPVLDVIHAQPETAASLERLLKAPAESTLLLQQENSQRLAGEGLAPTSAELQDGILQALWGMRCDAALKPLSVSVKSTLPTRLSKPAHSNLLESRGACLLCASGLGSGGPCC